MHPLAERICGFIQRFEEDEATFQALALDLFAHQFRENILYQRFCLARSATPETVCRWQDIPAAPAEAFKRFDLTCVPIEETRVVFHSSGTTGQQAGRHYMDAGALTLYDTSLGLAFHHWVLPDKVSLPLWSLVASPEEAPHSSLSYMVGALMRRASSLPHRYFWKGGRLRVEEFQQALQSLGEPVIVFGTAFAFVHFLEATTARFVLPAGSRLVETGGFKGRSREVSRDELYTQLQERLGLPKSHLVSEYGMSEMASQFYDTTLREALLLLGESRQVRKAGPPWVRTQVIDPLTGQEAPIGQAGLLRHFDLANFNSVMAIQTEDMGRAVEGGFELLGRAPHAQVRGCSLTAEEMLKRD